MCGHRNPRARRHDRVLNGGAALSLPFTEDRLQTARQREFDEAWRSACRKGGYTGTLRWSGAGRRGQWPGLEDARDRRAQFGHNQAAKVVSLIDK